MKRSTNLSLSEIRVGLIVGVSFLVSALVIIAYGKISNIFLREVELTVLFHNVQGLTQGAPVRLLGIDSGFVSSVNFVRFHGDRYVSVRMKITKKRFEELSAGTTASIHTQGLMGIKYVELTPGKSSEGPLSPSLPIMGLESNSIGAVMKSGNEIAGNLKTLSQSLRNLAKQAEEGQGTVGKLLGDPALYRNLNQSAENISALAFRLENGPGTMSKLIRSDEIYGKLETSLGSLNRLLENMNSGSGLSGKVVNDPEMAQSFKDSLLKFNEIVTQIRSGKGVAGEILYDPKMADRVNRTLDQVDSLLKDMKDHPKKYFTVEVHVF